MSSKPKLKSQTKAGAVQAQALGKGIMESAQQIWLAGLGAFAKAQAEGGKLFDTLVKEGSAIEQKTRRFTDSKVHEVRGAVESSVGAARQRATDTWDRLEKVFEDRVSRSLSRLGVPGRQDMDALAARVEQLARAVHQLNGAAPKASGQARSRKPQDDLAALEAAQIAKAKPKPRPRSSRK
ncbi:MAG: phasin family protein [Xanthomonadaceae bacterium]|nr:phasin family protein [Xanthomonadaceae bacterium]MDE2178889.1 phasin family protein [Xanthomonadaceae bacterium]MDE2245646.1 phasin family protein [Xanthomonadaceae bacterium]